MFFESTIYRGGTRVFLEAIVYALSHDQKRNVVWEVAGGMFFCFVWLGFKI
jgi:hypothetical protein